MLLVGAASSSGGGYTLDDSLRFRASASAYLTRTASSAPTNGKKLTLSCWVKRGATGTRVYLAQSGAGTGNDNYSNFYFNANNTIQIGMYSVTPRVTTQVFRDPSAWYHFVVAYDTTQASADDRVKLYVNGEQVTSFTTNGTIPTDTLIAFTKQSQAMYIGTASDEATYFDGYITEYNLIDGQQLAPSDFGESDSNGTWIPKEYTGTYGTNGFYLPMKPTTQATGFNTVLYTGTGAAQSIAGVGFAPDFVWLKARTGSSYSHHLVDAVRGNNKFLMSNRTDAEQTSTDQVTSFDANGFSLGADSAGPNDREVNESTRPMVAWCWDAGGSTVTNTNGTIDSQVRANPSTGFSIATWTNESSGDDTVGHGLGVAPKLIITKLRSTSGDWYTQTTAIDGGLDYLKLNDTNAAASLPKALPTADVFTTDMGGTTTAVAYSFADVAGYQKIDKYTGNGSTTGPTVTTGFRPAFILIKSVDTAKSWGIWDGTRSVNNPLNKVLFPNGSGAEDTSDTYYALDVTDTGFQLKNSDSSWNSSGNEFIYMAIAETRDAKFNFDASGNKNNWTPNNINSNASNISTYDLMSDVPMLTDEDTANFPTFNPIAIGKATGGGSAYGAVDGNLLGGNIGSGGWAMTGTTMSIPAGSGKFYFEARVNTSGQNMSAGVQVENAPFVGDYIIGYNDSNGYGYANDGKKFNNNTGTSYGSSATTGDVIGIAVDASGTTANLEFFKNGSSMGVAFSGIAGNLVPSFSSTAGASQVAINFGQQPFAYTPPTGYKKLNTFNLPDSTITDGSNFFDTQLWTGNDANPRSFSDTAFSPDFVWYKSTNNAYYHNLYDSVRGVTRTLYSNDVSAEYVNDVSGTLKSFDSDGFTVGGDSSVTTVNQSGGTYVGWQWRGSDSSSATYTVKVVSDSGNKYRFDDFGTSAVTLNLHETGTYTFDQSDSSNSGHPLRFSATSDGTHGGGSEYTTGVTVTGTPGTAGAKTVIVVAASAPTLYYYCSVHSGMGGQANTNVTQGSSNFAGTIVSTVSANPTAGFSIVNYVGTGSNATIGHGLGAALKFLIVKDRDAAEGWMIQSQILTGNTNGTFHFNTDAEYTGSSTAFQGTLPTSTVFSIGTAGNTNTNTQKYVAYCFAEVEGYSKMSTYTGNGSADGPFIYTGFRPAWIMFRSTILCNWVIVDSARSTFNVMDDSLYPNTTGTEITTITDVDFLSNGFKWRANLPNETNASGQTYVYMAFAENPFKNSNAR